MLELEGQWGNRRQIYLHYRSPRRGEMLGVKPTEGRFSEPEQGKPGANSDSFDVSGIGTAVGKLKVTILGIYRHFYFFGTWPGSSSWSDSTFHAYVTIYHQVYFRA